ncbi:MAG: DUF3309 family protein [Luteolibacter sp.]
MIISILIVAITAILLVIGSRRNWGYAPASLLSLLFIVPIIMMLAGLL